MRPYKYIMLVFVSLLVIIVMALVTTVALFCRVILDAMNWIADSCGRCLLWTREL